MDAIKHGLPAITPEDYELKETGTAHRARTSLMRGPSRIEAQELRYLEGMAKEVGYRFLPKTEVNGWARERKSLLGRIKALAAKKPKPKPKVALTKKTSPVKEMPRKQPKATLKRIKYFTRKKGAAHIEKDLGIKMDFHYKILDKQEREMIGKRLRTGELYTPKAGYLATTDIPKPSVKPPKKPKPEPKRSYELSKILKPLEKAEIPKIVAPPKRKKAAPKRRKSHVERNGKTMRKLKKRIQQGVKVFSFPDNVWKVRSTQKKRRKR